MNEIPKPGGGTTAAKAANRQRLARALRANLLRRKAQARAIDRAGARQTDHDKNVTEDTHSPESASDGM